MPLIGDKESFPHLLLSAETPSRFMSASCLLWRARDELPLCDVCARVGAYMYVHVCVHACAPPSEPPQFSLRRPFYTIIGSYCYFLPYHRKL